MNPDHLTSLLSAGAPHDAGPSPACPDEHRIAGYVDGRLDDAARQQVELHLADCVHCLALVGLLCRGRRGADPVENVPRTIGAPAEHRTVEGQQRRWRLAPQWAAAAALVLVVPVLLLLGRNLDGRIEGQRHPASSVTRVTESTPGLQVLSPGAGAAVDADRLSFRWTEVPGTPYYGIRIVTDEGDLVIQQRVDGTTWRPPAQLNLRPGVEYFVLVDAYPSGDKAVSSEHVPFRVAD